MIEAHLPMGGSSVAHGGDRDRSSVQKSSESLQLQQRGNYNHDLPGRYLSAWRVNPDPMGLFVIGWLALTQYAHNYFDRHELSRILPYTATFA